jgi:20S proteasome alpha/beta subunit
MLHNLRHKPPFNPEPRLVPRANPERLRKRKAVTIAIGVLCSDGIVLAADTQESVDEYSKISRPKVFQLSLADDRVKAVLAGAGDSVFIDALRGKLESALDRADLTCDSLESKAEAAIVSYYRNIWPLYATQRDRPEGDLLIGLRGPDGIRLLHADGPLVRRVDSYESVGFGTVFSTYHLDKLFTPTMDVEMTAAVAIHVLDVVKKNVEFCGGDTHVFVISANGEIEQKDEAYIESKAASFEKFLVLSDKLLARAASLQFNEERLLETLNNLYDAMPRLKESKAAQDKLLTALEGITNNPNWKVLALEVGQRLTKEDVKELAAAAATFKKFTAWYVALSKEPSAKTKGKKRTRKPA